MMQKPCTLMVLNGANLNMLGVREPDVYGTATLATLESLCHETGKRLGCTILCHQTNHEGTFLEHIHSAHGKVHGLVVNAGAWTHTSLALHDALRAVALPVVEVHLSNTYAREGFRHTSYVAPLALGVIAGFGVRGYVWALEALAETLLP